MFALMGANDEELFMPYAIKNNGWRAVGEDFDAADLLEGETLVDQIPQELVETISLADRFQVLAAVETVWRNSEMDFIGYQLTAIEDQDSSALPGTVAQWRDYRIRVRAWVDGAEGYPDIESRPVRPE